LGFDDGVDVVGEAVFVELVETDELAYSAESVVVLQGGDGLAGVHHAQFVDCFLDLVLDVGLELVAAVGGAHLPDVAHDLALTLLLVELTAVRLELVLLLVGHLLEVHAELLLGLFTLLDLGHGTDLVGGCCVDGGAVHTPGVLHFRVETVVHFHAFVLLEARFGGRRRSGAVTVAAVVSHFVEQNELVFAHLDFEFGFLVVEESHERALDLASLTLFVEGRPSALVLLNQIYDAVCFGAQLQYFVIQNIVLLFTLHIVVYREVESSLVFAGKFDCYDSIMDVGHPLSVESGASEVCVVDSHGDIRGEFIFEFLSVDFIDDIKHIQLLLGFV